MCQCNSIFNCSRYSRILPSSVQAGNCRLKKISKNMQKMISKYCNDLFANEICFTFVYLPITFIFKMYMEMKLKEAEIAFYSLSLTSPFYNGQLAQFSGKFVSGCGNGFPIEG